MAPKQWILFLLYQETAGDSTENKRMISSLGYQAFT